MIDIAKANKCLFLYLLPLFIRYEDVFHRLLKQPCTGGLKMFYIFITWYLTVLLKVCLNIVEL